MIETTLQKIKKNFSYLLAAEVIIRAMMLILTITLAKLSSPEKLGVYSLALSVGNLFEIIFNMGLGTVFLQRVSAKPVDMEKEVATFLPLRIVLSAASLVIYTGFALLLDKNADTFWSLILAGLHFSLLSVTTFLWACFDARQKMKYTAWAKLLMYPVIFAAGMYFIYTGQPTGYILGAYVAGILISLAYTIRTVKKHFCPIRLTWNMSAWKKILISGWPITLAATFVFIYNYLDTIIISVTHGEGAVGLYHAGYKIVGTIFILASLINQAYLPSLIHTNKTAPDKTGDIFHKSLASAFFWSIPITMGGMYLAERIILFIYGTPYEASIIAFRILMANCVIYFLSSAMINFMYSLNKQRQVVKVFFAGAVVNTLANLYVIPRWGIEGASVTTVVAELIVLTGIYFLCRAHTGMRVIASGWRSIAAGTVMLGALHVTHFESIIITTLFGAGVYFLVSGVIGKKLFRAGFSELTGSQKMRQESMPKENP